jgi:hypothetical protein
MWWECSECGSQIKRGRRPICCGECGIAGPVFVPAERDAGQVCGGATWRDAWWMAGFERPPGLEWVSELTG